VAVSGKEGVMKEIYTTIMIRFQAAAERAGLRHVRIGNLHLLGEDY